MQEISSLQAKNAQEAEALRIKYLSKKGEISQLMNDFRSVPADLKKEVGMKINQLKNLAQEKINALKECAGEASASSAASASNSASQSANSATASATSAASDAESASAIATKVDITLVGAVSP